MGHPLGTALQHFLSGTRPLRRYQAQVLVTPGRARMAEPGPDADHRRSQQDSLARLRRRGMGSRGLGRGGLAREPVWVLHLALVDVAKGFTEKRLRRLCGFPMPLWRSLPEGYHIPIMERRSSWLSTSLHKILRRPHLRCSKT